MDAVYVMNYVINKELKRKGGKVFALFADLKVAFDKVDRGKLNKGMKRIGVEDRLRRIMETYRETRNIVRVGNKETEEF